MRAISKTGVPIIGTYEVVNASRRIDPDSFSRRPDGSLGYENSDRGTEVFWDGMRQVRRFGKLVFMAEDGSEWTEDQIVLQEVVEVAECLA